MLCRTLLVLFAGAVLLGGCTRQTPSAEAAELAKEIIRTISDIPRADTLLGELRELAKTHPEDAAVREQLARGLNNAIGLGGADVARTDGLLAELRELAGNHPENEAIRKWLASGLNNAIVHSASEPPRADGLIDELWAFAEAHPQDAAVRNSLGMGLSAAIRYGGSDAARADFLLERLRELAGIGPEGTLTPALSQREREQEGAVREWLASGLGHAINYSGPDFARADGLLAELRALAVNSPREGAIRASLARSYVWLVEDATQAGDVERAADMAEALVPLREAVLSQPDMMPVFQQAFSAALELAIEQNNAEVGRRLTTASKALFGE